tara:strand:- start:5402 stop:8887 length:3486 start_codon:yes stop_codon:yes gene_type:complete
MQTILKKVLIVGLITFTAGSLKAQQTIPDSANGVVYRGNEATDARGVIDGNLIETNFRNHGELSRWDDDPWGVWPRGIGGRHIDGVGVIVAGYVEAKYSEGTATFEDYKTWANANAGMPGDTTLNPLIINYRQAGLRQSPYSGATWGWLPLPGFNNPLRTDPVLGTSAPVPALSNDEQSWPAFWPDRLSEEDPGWPGSWNGRDGRFPSSDLESYYVIDDFSDLEYAVGPVLRDTVSGPLSDLGVYYPSPNEDPTMGGFGLQMQVRLFQWANVLAEDTMFLIYRITNKGEGSQERLLFAQIVDYGLGNEEIDDNAAFDDVQDVVYGWDSDGIGTPTRAGQSDYDLGYTGFAFLESPANENNFIDDDQDGIVDESRFDENYLLFTTQADIDDYVATNYDATAFEVYNNEPYTDKPAYKASRWFTTDENLDWIGFSDANENGTWEEGEVLNNDVGRDGLGPFDQFYPGPDDGEGDGIPTNGEPNYNELDVDESDQIGLTGFDLNTRPFYESGDNLRDDTWLFARIEENLFSNPDYTIPPTVVSSEPFILFVSGEVQLSSDNDPTGKSTDFFSTAWIFGDDEDDFFKNRRTVQNIYNSDYNFAQPPITPTLTAVPADGQVLLSWDTTSVRSYDRFLQDFDFEGYKLYKGTNNVFSDARTISDVNGTPTFYEPIAQFDLAINLDGTENTISGTIPVLEGEAPFNLGTNSGLQFYYVDNEVTNGKTYYYAIVAYDRGIPPASEDATGIDPQENTFRVAVNSSGAITGTSINAAVVTPLPRPAGYVEGGNSVDLSSVTTGTGTGSANVSVVSDSDLNSSYIYRVSFSDTAAAAEVGDYRLTSSYSVKELTRDTVLVKSTSYSSTTSIIDGFTVGFSNTPTDEVGEIIAEKSGYVSNEGTENELFNFDPTQLDGLATDWALDIVDSFEEEEGLDSQFKKTDNKFEILFVDPNDSVYTPPRRQVGFDQIDIPVFVTNLSNGEKEEILFRDNDDSGDLSDGDNLFLTRLIDRARTFRYVITINVGGSNIPPSPGDKVIITSKRQFGSDDTFEFALKTGSIDNALAAEELGDIYVVPNPYVGAAEWEIASNSIGRGERKIYFNNVPTTCTIRIFNVRGELIKTIEHEGATSEGAVPWDLKTNNNEDVAYGVYFYHVKAEGIGEYTDKFAIIK